MLVELAIEAEAAEAGTVAAESVAAAAQKQKLACQSIVTILILFNSCCHFCLLDDSFVTFAISF